jgi:hypothetical protein
LTREFFLRKFQINFKLVLPSVPAAYGACIGKNDSCRCPRSRSLQFGSIFNYRYLCSVLNTLTLEFKIDILQFSGEENVLLFTTHNFTVILQAGCRTNVV